MTIEFKLPDLGENIEAADIVNVLVAEGHVIQEGQNVLELETDKAVIELPSPQGGRVVKVHVQAGDHVPVGATLLTIERTGEAKEAPAQEAKQAPPEKKIEEKPAAAAEKIPEKPPREPEEKEEPSAQAAPPVEKAAQVEEEPVPVVRESPDKRRRPAPAGPATRRLARELGVDLHLVSGSGPGGRITPEDVQAFVRQLASKALSGQRMTPGAPPPLPDFSQWGPIERQPMGGIRRKTAENVSLAWQLCPQVTQYDLADITELEAARKRYVQARPDMPHKVTVTVLVLKAVVAALKAFPQFNSSLDSVAGIIIYKRYYHLGVAVDTEHGLLVPVIRDVDRKSVIELASELGDLAARARERKLEIGEMRGGTFTITNLGGIGGTAFSPIVNYPEVAILGLARSRQEQVIQGGEAQVRLLLPLCLSYDHRVIDGADGARFTRKVAELLSDPLQLLLEG